MVTGIPYSEGMSLAHHGTPGDTRAARAAFVEAALKQDRWSIRQTAVAIGMSHSALAARVAGKTSFFAEDIELIALHLHRDPIAFYAEYLNAGAHKNGPEEIPSGPHSLPDLDSNQEPAVTQLDQWRRDHRDPLHPLDIEEPDHYGAWATVSNFFSRKAR